MANKIGQITNPSIQPVNLVTHNGWMKLGVQGPVAMKMKINGREIIIGRTGIYELDEDIVITEFIINEESGFDTSSVIIDYIEKGE